MSSTKTPDYLLWIDLETTHLDPDIGWPVEVAAIVTDWNLETVASYHTVLKTRQHQWDTASDVAHQMHIDNGLKAESLQSTINSRDASFRLHGLLTELVHDGKVLAAGSSIHFDKRWLEEYFWLANDLLHYRLFDGRSLQTAMERWAGMRFPEHVSTHRALDDITHTLDMARRIRGALVCSQYDGFR